MTHPYRSSGRAGAKLKFSKMLGSTKGAKHMNDDSVDNQNTTVRNGVEDVKIMGSKPKGRLDRARGGRTVVNVIVKGGSEDKPQPMPLPPLPMPPPGAISPPVAGPPKPHNMTPLPPPGAGGPGAGLPLRASGGKVMAKKASGGSIGGEPKSSNLKQWAGYASKNSYNKKAGGGVGPYPMTGGSDSGVGRLQRSKKLAKKHSGD